MPRISPILCNGMPSYKCEIIIYFRNSYNLKDIVWGRTYLVPRSKPNDDEQGGWSSKMLKTTLSVPRSINDEHLLLVKTGCVKNARGARSARGEQMLSQFWLRRQHICPGGQWFKRESMTFYPPNKKANTAVFIKPSEGNWNKLIIKNYSADLK